MRGPDLTELSFLRPSDQQSIRAGWPGIEHWHALAAAQQIDLHEVHISQQMTSPFAQIAPPSRCAGSLVGRREDLDNRYEALLGIGVVDLDECLAELFHDESPQHFRLGFAWRLCHTTA